MEDAQAERDIKRNSKLREEVETIHKPVWQDISNYFAPDQSDVNTQKTENVSNWTQNVFDTTPRMAARTCSTGMRNWLFPSQEPWVAFEAPDYLDSQAKDEAALWLSDCTHITLKELARSNFYQRVIEDNDSICTFGTGNLFLEEGKRALLNFRTFKIGSYSIAEDSEGYVDTVYREFEFTSRQAAQEFGIDALPKKIQEDLKKGGDKKHKFLHVVMPREDGELTENRGMLGPKSKAIVSRYIALQDRTVVKEDGYDEMPYFVSRFAKWGSGSPYGFCPSHLVLPDARQTNYVVQYTDALAELLAYPRVIAGQSVIGDIDMRPGGVTVFDENKPNGVPKEWMTQGSYPLLQEVLKDKRDLINRAFYVNMFQMLEQLSDKRMTAYEIAQRMSEKLEGFTPVFDRQVSERINPMMTRVFNMLLRAGRFPQPPMAMMVQDSEGKLTVAQPNVVLTSRIALALKASLNTGITNTMSAILPIAQIKPDILDNYNFDTMARLYTLNNGAPASVLMPIDQMQKIRQARAMQMAQQQAIENAQGVAKAGKDAAKGPSGAKEAFDNAMGMGQ